MKPEKRKNCGIISGGAGCGQYPGKNYAAFLRLVFYIVCFLIGLNMVIFGFSFSTVRHEWNYSLIKDIKRKFENIFSVHLIVLYVFYLKTNRVEHVIQLVMKVGWGIISYK